jgi:hypothetical protein
MGVRTLDLLLTFHSVGETIGAVTDDIYTRTVLEGEAITAEAVISARDHADGTSNSYKIIAKVSRFTGLAAVMGGASPTNLFTDELDLDWDATFVLVGNDLVLRVTGEALRTIEWVADITLQVLVA